MQCPTMHKEELSEVSVGHFGHLFVGGDPLKNPPSRGGSQLWLAKKCGFVDKDTPGQSKSAR